MQMKRIHSRKLAFQLRLLGFKIVKIEPNMHHPELDVYYFEETPEFLKAFDEVLTNWK